MRVILKASFMLLMSLALMFTAIYAFLFATPLVAWITIIPCLGISIFLIYSTFQIVRKALDK